VNTSTPPSPHGWATAHSGSRKACSCREVWNVCVTVNAESASLASASPRFTCWWVRMFPPGWSSGAPGASACSGVVTGSSTV